MSLKLRRVRLKDTRFVFFLTQLEEWALVQSQKSSRYSTRSTVLVITLWDFKFSLNWNNRLLVLFCGQIPLGFTSKKHKAGLNENQTVSQINRMFPGTPVYRKLLHLVQPHASSLEEFWNIGLLRIKILLEFLIFFLLSFLLKSNTDWEDLHTKRCQHVRTGVFYGNYQHGTSEASAYHIQESQWITSNKMHEFQVRELAN